MEEYRLPGEDLPTVQWAGGNIPLDPEAVVFVQFRDGLWSRARRVYTLRWLYENACDDIVAYKVLP